MSFNTNTQTDEVVNQALHSLTEHLPEAISRAINDHYSQNPPTVRQRGSFSVAIDPETDEVVREMLGGGQNMLSQARQEAQSMKDLIDSMETVLTDAMKNHKSRSQYKAMACLFVTFVSSVVATSGLLWWLF